MKYAFFPGCSLESTAWDFDKSTRAICKSLGIQIEDIPGWVCCGSTPAHATSNSLAVALPALNLKMAKDAGFDQVAVACASCYARLRTANHKIVNSPVERESAERIIEATYDGSVKVRHILDVLVNDYGPAQIRKRVTNALRGIRVASYYGCLLSRPPDVVAFDDPEHPTCMDKLVEAAGAQAVDWPYKTECCGASLSIVKTNATNRLGYRLLAMAERAGAQCIVVACPLCQMNLDFRQADSRKDKPLADMPVMYITQFLGLALGLSPESLGLNALTINAEPLFKNLCGAAVPAAAVKKGGASQNE